MAYSPAQGMMLSAVVFAAVTWEFRSSLRRGGFRRGYTPLGKDPLILRDKEPAAFQRNVWASVIILVVTVIGFVLSLIQAIWPGA